MNDMIGYILAILVSMGTLITYTWNNLEYKNYPSISSCTGECYEEYKIREGTALAGRDSEYIIDRLTTYKNRGEVGKMSATMWSQASLLSDQDIETLGKFIEETLE